MTPRRTSRTFKACVTAFLLVTVLAMTARCQSSSAAPAHRPAVHATAPATKGHR